ncbi:MAG TPA: Ig-like domain-containing protein [Gemmatimonadales bacterium]
MHISRWTGWARVVVVSVLAGLFACTATTPPTDELEPVDDAVGLVDNPAARITLSLDTLWFAQAGQEAQVSVQAFDADGRELTGARIKWWGNNAERFTFTPELCTAPCSVTVHSGSEGLGKLIAHEYGGVARDTTWVRVGGDAPQGSAGSPPPTNQTPEPPIPQPPGENAARITLSYSDLVLGPPGAQVTVSVRAFGADGREWSGVPIRWWKSSNTTFSLSVRECRSPCSSVLSTRAVGGGKVIVRHYGGVARDTMPVRITAESNPPTEPPPSEPPGEPPPGEPPPGEPPPGEPPPPPPPPPPPVGASCNLTGATVLAGTRSSQFRVDGVPAGRVYDARSFAVRYSAAGGAVRVAGGANICWHGGRVLGTMDSVTTSWATYHDAYGFHLTGNTLIIEDVYAENVGDGIKWIEESTNNFTIRRVHLKDMKDDCVETDWLRGGSISDVLFEGCYVFLGIRPRSSVSLNGSGNTITVDGAVVWHKHIRNGYNGEPDNAGQIFKVDGGTPSTSPRLRLRNIVLRVDPHPNTSGGGSPYSLNPGGIVVESANNTLVWTGAGAYPEAVPSGWTLTRDKGVYDRAVAAWKARNSQGAPPPAPPPPPPPPGPAPVATVTVSPSAPSVLADATVQLAASLLDAAGNPLSGRTVTWSSAATGIATVSSSGLVRGVAAGQAVITASSEGKSGNASVMVTAGSSPPPPPPPPPPGGAVTLLAVGDIADCGSSGDEATGRLVDAYPTTPIITLGDNAYDDGSTSDFANCYEPSWGRHKARTRPSPGNHDYHESGAGPYYAYFGANAGPAGRGYYSFDLGDWHLISLNSNVSMSAGSAQEQWLRADLAATTKRCVLAYWHHPRFSSSKHGNESDTQPLWQALYNAGAELVLAGHDHSYERFAPQTPSGAADPTNGVRSFVVGTGGRKFYSLVTRQPNSEAFGSNTYGVLKLTLGATSYSWQFLAAGGGTYTDSGTGQCK